MTTELVLLLALGCCGLVLLAIAAIAPPDEPSAPAPSGDPIPDDAWLERQLAGLLDNHKHDV